MNTYSVTVTRQAGVDPITQKPTPEASETLRIAANSEQEAYQQSMAQCSLRFMGQERLTTIDGQLYLGRH